MSAVRGNPSGASRIGESEGNGEHKNQRHSGADGLAARLRAAARGKIRAVSILRFDCRADVQEALEHLLHEERGKHGDERAAVYSAFAGGGLVGNPVGTYLYDSSGVQQLQGRERCDERGGGVAQAEHGCPCAGSAEGNLKRNSSSLQGFGPYAPLQRFSRIKVHANGEGTTHGTEESEEDHTSREAADGNPGSA